MLDPVRYIPCQVCCLNPLPSEFFAGHKHITGVCGKLAHDNKLILHSLTEPCTDLYFEECLSRHVNNNNNNNNFSPIEECL